MSLGASSSGPAAQFVKAWVAGELGPRKSKEASLSRDLNGRVDTLYSYAEPLASIYDRQYIVIATRDTLSRTSVTTNRHLQWVTYAVQTWDGDKWNVGSVLFPAGRVAFMLEGRVPVTEEQWISALVEFEAREDGRSTRFR